MDPKKMLVNLERSELAFYEAGRIKGQLEGITEAIGQLKKAAIHYRGALVPEKKGDEQANTDADWLSRWESLAAGLEKGLEKISIEVKLRLDLALALRGEKTKPLPVRAKNAIMGLMNGWNE